MYAIIQKGAHQYRVEPGQFIKMEKMELDVGAVWKCREVLAFLSKEGHFTAGTPYVEKAEVSGRVVRHGKGKKSLVFKKKRRKGYRRTQGHRQEFTEIYIEVFGAPSGEKVEKKWPRKTKDDKQIGGAGKDQESENKTAAKKKEIV